MKVTKQTAFQIGAKMAEESSVWKHEITVI